MFISKSDAVLQVQNKVQEVTVKKSDKQVVSLNVAETVATVQIGEPIADIRCVLHVNASSPTAVEVASAAISGTSIVCTLSEAMESDDCLIVKYVVDEQA